ncbi:DUF6074 family protein [Rhizobium sp. EC-SD404]|uniref:DUF6074 family protein n=1 Tax=Rhizobium sp. EC-SD404 TaxID=2038389 RepID=UPI001257C248|nr:DUF6074 family protein [Rhizobium sp. EC-SD404]VVT04714.1 conserved hypothetical protein [Rhizobium sp. EC-SD404]
MMTNHPPRPHWESGRQVIVFPMVNRTSRVRMTAQKLMAKPTDRAAESYQNQVTAGLVKAFETVGIPEDVQSAQISAFWRAVTAEINRLHYSGHDHGGAA